MLRPCMSRCWFPMKRLWLLTLCLLPGCSTHPIVDLRDCLTPGRLTEQEVAPYGGVCRHQGPVLGPAAPPLVPPIVGPGIVTPAPVVPPPVPLPPPGTSTIPPPPPITPGFPKI